MNIWLDTMHMFIQTIHHIITIHLAYMQSPTKSPSLSIYAFTDNINQLTFMYSPTISQSINIYVFTNNITINHHICIHQQHHNQSTTSYYFSQFKWGENTPHYDKHHICIHHIIKSKFWSSKICSSKNINQNSKIKHHFKLKHLKFNRKNIAYFM